MHEFMKHELCMCIEMHTCDVMHVGEFRILQNGHSHAIILTWRWRSNLVFDTTPGQYLETCGAEICQTAPSCTLLKVTGPHLVANEGRQCVRHPQNRGVVCETDPLGQTPDKK